MRMTLAGAGSSKQMGGESGGLQRKGTEDAEKHGVVVNLRALCASAVFSHAVLNGRASCVRAALFFCLCFFATVSLHAAGPDIAEASAALLRCDTGEWLYRKAAETPRYPASTTKILTTLVAIEAGDLDRAATVAASDLKVEPSVVGLRVGQKVPMRALLYAAMLRSANDAAMTIARTVGGSTSDFAALMNQRAAAAGAKRTHFANPHGLTNPAHVTTARDLALIMRAAMTNPLFRQITGTKAYTWKYSEKPEVLENHNRMLRTYTGFTGGKTG